jgi:hypothetical protein
LGFYYKPKTTLNNEEHGAEVIASIFLFVVAFASIETPTVSKKYIMSVRSSPKTAPSPVTALAAPIAVAPIATTASEDDEDSSLIDDVLDSVRLGELAELQAAMDQGIVNVVKRVDDVNLFLTLGFSSLSLTVLFCSARKHITSYRIRIWTTQCGQVFD